MAELHHNASPRRNVPPPRRLRLSGTLRPLFERWHPGLANKTPASASQAEAA